ncbi:MAG: hypothetical protein EZS28_025983, partial [Streblomastix strix]
MWIQVTQQHLYHFEGSILSLIGEGENQSSIIQKDSSHNLFILKDSQLNTSLLTAEIWGQETALIQIDGNQMSKLNGLRVNGGKLQGQLAYGPVIEVIKGGLNIIDTIIKDIGMIINERNSNNDNRRNLKGLIEMKNSTNLLQLENFQIKNITTINKQSMSSIMMNAGHLKLRDGTFLGEAYTSSGSAIRAYPTGPSTIDVEGVVFKGQGDGYGTNGGAVYVDMQDYDVTMSFRRCIFIGNKADYGSNVFILYAQPSQRINRNSFSGCTAIVKNSHEQDISVCYSIGNLNEVFIDERDLLHSSWQRQQSEGVVRFISNSDTNHTFDSSIKCGSPQNPCDSFITLSQYLKSEDVSIDGSTGRVETLIFGEGKYSTPFIDLSLTRSSIVNIIGYNQDETEINAQPNNQNVMIQGDLNQNIVIERLCLALSPSSPLVGLIRTQGSEAGLVLQDMKVQGYLETNPQNTMFELQYLFQIEGFALMRNVTFEHIYLRTGSILNVIGLRRIADDNRMEWLAKTSIGFYSSCGVGSALTINRLTLDLSQSVFEEPFCFGNMLYLNQTQVIIKDCYLKGYNNTYSELLPESGEEQQLGSVELCPDNPLLFSSTEFALIYINGGNYISENNVFENTRIGAIKIESAEAELKSDSFIDPWEEKSQLDGSEVMITCVGKSSLTITDPIVNNKTELQCSTSNMDDQLYPSSRLSNDNECMFGIVFEDECQMFLSNKWNIPKLPIPMLMNSKVIVNITKKQEPLKFQIEGEQLLLALFSVKIVEMGNKTDSEIRQEMDQNKDIGKQYVKEMMKIIPEMVEDIQSGLL